MAASTAITGYGATFGIESGTPDTYDVVAEVVGITTPNRSRTSVDVTHIASDDEYMEFIGGMRDGGEVTLTLNYTSANSTALLAEFEADSGQYQITLPDSATLTFSGFCTAYQVGELGADDKITSSATFKQSGKATVA